MRKACSLLLAALVAGGALAACAVPSERRGLRFEDPAPLGSSFGSRQEAEADAGDLAKKTQNPVSDLISVPFQSNFGFDFGKDNDTQVTVNIQPVIPVDMGDWTLLNRPILPVVYLPQTAPGTDDEFGLGDLTYTAWYSPKPDPGEILWGVGPVIQLPTRSARTRSGSVRRSSPSRSTGPGFMAASSATPGAWAARIATTSTSSCSSTS